MLCVMNARLGRQHELRQLIAESKKRSLFGSDEQMVKDASEGLSLMQTEPQSSFKCGPYAVRSLLSNEQAKLHCQLIENAKSTQFGTNLEQVNNLSQRAGLNMQMAKRSPGASLIVPSIMHWTLDHFGALTERNGELITIKDPTFGANNTLCVTEKTLNEESDGYFLVPAGPLPKGWKKVADAEGKAVWGRGTASGSYAKEQYFPSPQFPRCYSKARKENEPTTCDICTKSDGGGAGMAKASIWLMNTSVHITDTPLSYTPPLGDAIRFNVNYNQEESDQPSTFSFTNLGMNWKILLLLLFDSWNWLCFDGSSARWR